MPRLSGAEGRRAIWQLPEIPEAARSPCARPTSFLGLTTRAGYLVGGSGSWGPSCSFLAAAIDPKSGNSSVLVQWSGMAAIGLCVRLRGGTILLWWLS